MKTLLKIQFIVAVVMCLLAFLLVANELKDPEPLEPIILHKSLTLQAEDAVYGKRTFPVDDIKTIRVEDELHEGCKIFLDTENSSICIHSNYIEVVE